MFKILKEYLSTAKKLNINMCISTEIPSILDNNVFSIYCQIIGRNIWPLSPKENGRQTLKRFFILIPPENCP
jgi:hypothetical protein